MHQRQHVVEIHDRIGVVRCKCNSGHKRIIGGSREEFFDLPGHPTVRRYSNVRPRSPCSENIISFNDKLRMRVFDVIIGELHHGTPCPSRIGGTLIAYLFSAGSIKHRPVKEYVAACCHVWTNETAPIRQAKRCLPSCSTIGRTMEDIFNAGPSISSSGTISIVGLHDHYSIAGCAGCSNLWASIAWGNLSLSWCKQYFRFPGTSFVKGSPKIDV